MQAKMEEMMMEQGMAMLDQMMSWCMDKKMILDTINTEGATPELAMQLMTTMTGMVNMLMHQTGAHQMLMWGGHKSVSSYLVDLNSFVIFTIHLLLFLKT